MIILAIFGGALVVLGAAMFLNAKKGEQQCALGGAIFIIGLICIGFGGRPAFKAASEPRTCTSAAGICL